MEIFLASIAKLPAYFIAVIVIIVPLTFLASLLAWTLLFSKDKEYARVTLSGFGLNLNLSVGTKPHFRDNDRRERITEHGISEKQI